MRITVTRTIDVPDDLDSVNDLEMLVRDEGFALMRELMSTAWQSFQRQRFESGSYCCPKCASRDLWRWGDKSAELLTAFGQVELARERVKCRACGSVTQPLDHWLSELGSHRATWFVQELFCLAAASWPYDACQTIVERMLLGQVSHEQIRRVANAEGQQVVAGLKQQAQAVLDEPVFEEPVDDGLGLNVALDGDWICSRDNPEGMEAKVGVVYSGVEVIGTNGEKERRKLLNRRYAATFQGSTLLGKLIYAEAAKLDVERAGRLRLLGDGAGWIDTVAQEHFARAKRILDLWHLERQLSRGLGAAIRDKEELARQRAKISRLIRRGRSDEALGVLRALVDERRQAQGHAPEEPAVPKELLETVTYVAGHQAAIIDYESDQEAGEHVGSGAIEKTGDLAVNRRFKGHRGMTWWRKNADSILALRITHLNGDWDAYWQNRRQQSRSQTEIAA